MSVFASLLAGGVGGLGAGISANAVENQRLEREMALAEEKRQAALELQRQRGEDKLFQMQLAAAQKENFASQFGNGGRSGAGGGGLPFFDQIGRAMEDEKAANVLLAQTRAFAGDDAATRLAGILGKGGGQYGLGQEQMPTDEDVRQSMAYNGPPRPPSSGIDPVRAQEIALKGQQELQRAFALLSNKGEIKNYAEGERFLMGNDVGQEVLRQQLMQGVPLADAMKTVDAAMSPSLSEKNQLSQRRIDASLQNAQTRSDSAQANAIQREDGQEVRSLRETKTKLLKAMVDPMVDKKTKDFIQSQLDLVDRQLTEATNSRQQRAAAPAPAANWQAGPSTPPRTPRDAVAAYRQKYGLN